MKHKLSNKVSIVLAVLAIILIAMVLTCPGERRHEKAVNRLAIELADELVPERDAYETAIIKEFAENYIAETLYVKDYVLFSTGTLLFDGMDSCVSFGILGVTFTKSYKRILKEATDNYELEALIDALK